MLFGERKAYRADWREAVLLLGGVLFPRRVQRLDGLISAAIDGMYGGGKRLLRWFGVRTGTCRKGALRRAAGRHDARSAAARLRARRRAVTRG